MSTKEQLEAAISLANTWSGRSTRLLAIGILAEYVILPLLDERKWWNRTAKYTFAIFVLLGNVGEYGFSSKISQGAGELQRLSDGELTLAESNATAAYNKAAEAETQLASPRTQAARAETDAANAKARQLSVEIELNQQRERTAVAERTLLELQEHNKSRILTSDQGQKIADSLRQFSGQKANLFVYTGDNEIVGIANQVYTILKTPVPNGGAGWIVSASTGQEMGRAVPGILVELKPSADGQSRAAAAALVSSLTAEHLFVTGPQPMQGASSTLSTGPRDPDAPITITIGKKP